MEETVEDRLEMEVTVISDNIVSPLGLTTQENFQKLINDVSGIRLIENKELSQFPFYCSLFNDETLIANFKGDAEKYTRLEKIFILSIEEALGKSNVDITSPKTLLILSSTKGNIDLIEKKNPIYESERIHLWRMAEVVAQYFKYHSTPIVISNACISGSMAIVTAARFLRSGKYKNVIVSGADIISSFTVSGFQAFKAMSANPCKPFDVARDGITLGEGCGTMILTNQTTNQKEDSIRILGGAISNDANHISGPSRNGEGLFLAIRKTLEETSVHSSEVDFISAHGTGTLYNDEMESIAIARSNLNHASVNGLKGYFGHTLGAAGIIESILSIRSLKKNYIIGTRGFDKKGVSEDLKIVETSNSKKINYCLKTSSGFGGCNATILFKNTSR